jgi:hypothetical protein
VLLKDGDLRLSEQDKQKKLKENEEKAKQLIDEYNGINDQLNSKSEYLQLQQFNDV